MAKEKKVKDATVALEKEKKTKAKEVETEIQEEIEEVEEIEEEVVEEIEVDDDYEETTEDTKTVKKEMKEKAKKEKSAEKEKKQKRDGFFKSTAKEMRKVVWPSVGDVVKYSLAVIIFCVVLALFFEGINLLSAYIKGLFI